MDRAQKEAKVAGMHQSFQDATIMVVTHQNGMTVEESTNLRRQMLAAGASFRVTKNRLARIALKGTKFEGLDGLFTGPTAVAFSKSNDKLTIVGGGLGEKELDQTGIEALAKLPSLDELRAKIVGMISTPATRIAGVLQAPGGQLARVIGAYAQKGDAA